MQVGEWLGFVINTITMSFHIPERKMEKLKSLLGSVTGDTSSSYRELARIAGSIISIALAVGPISRLLTRQMYLAIESRSAWDHALRFSPALLEELRFWYSNIDSFNGYSLRPPLDSSTVIFSDAIDVAFGGFSASLDGVMASGMFTSEDLGQSSTYHAKWGPYTFDRFATYYNAQLPRFNSRFASPGCSGVNALAQDWSAENNWICPPVSLIVDSVRHLMSCFGRRTLIIPEWPCAHFWPFLREGSSRFSSYVAEVFVLPAVEDLRLEGPGQKQIYKSRPSIFRRCPKFRMLALRLDFR
ncbi:uncharacterized protein LOC111320674 [Stylophora pistillata]|uniref:uncharacterized protein LOC111320674 n=1 Tax=Stylophora pistillata TaxID=50429 RepID=UPI000C047255|nr:uncharacterized protein LOC111320674 [Stylophora pistillata]